MSAKLARGRFVVLEGGEGAGKSRSLKYLAGRLRHLGIGVVCSREPGGTPLAEELRRLLLSRREETLAPSAELLLVFAARAQHLAERIRPALARGDWVLCDRFTASSYAYQGVGRGLGAAPVAQLEQLVQGGLQPDLVLLLDLPPEQGVARAGPSHRQGELTLPAEGAGAEVPGLAPGDRIGEESLAFHRRVRACYLERAAADPHCRLIDASRPWDAVCGRLRRELDALLATSHPQP